MNQSWKVFKYQLLDVVRGRAVLGYAVFFGLAAFGLLQFGGGTTRALPSLATLIVLVVPLVCLLVATTAVYHRGDFIELLLSHPVGRRPVFAGIHLGLTLPLVAAFLAGLLIPLTINGAWAGHVQGILLLCLAGSLLTGVFTSIGLVIAFGVAEPARGSGFALLVWLGLAVLYDGLVLFAAYRWAAYPLERPMLGLMLLNPVDLARIMVLIALDAPALLGYTGAVFQDFFGGASGIGVTVAGLAAWTLVPGAWALRTFQRRDF